MRTLGFLGVAHIHTPSFVKIIKSRPDQFKVKVVWDAQPERAAIAAEHLHCRAVDRYDAIVA